MGGCPKNFLRYDIKVPSRRSELPARRKLGRAYNKYGLRNREALAILKKWAIAAGIKKTATEKGRREKERQPHIRSDQKVADGQR